MGVRILVDREQDMAVLYCSTSEWAFGPTFHDDDGHDADERAEAFLRWVEDTETWGTYEKEPFTTGRRDPRSLTERGLEVAYGDWLAQEAAQWRREDPGACVICEEPHEEDSQCPLAIGEREAEK